MFSFILISFFLFYRVSAKVTLWIGLCQRPWIEDLYEWSLVIPKTNNTNRLLNQCYNFCISCVLQLHFQSYNSRQLLYQLIQKLSQIIALDEQSTYCLWLYLLILLLLRCKNAKLSQTCRLNEGHVFNLYNQVLDAHCC